MIHCHQLAKVTVTRRGQISNLANKAIRSKQSTKEKQISLRTCCRKSELPSNSLPQMPRCNEHRWNYHHISGCDLPAIWQRMSGHWNTWDAVTEFHETLQHITGWSKFVYAVTVTGRIGIYILLCSLKSGWVSTYTRTQSKTERIMMWALK